MLTYQMFCESYHFEGCSGNAGAKKVFEFLCRPETICSMAVFSETGLPAFSGIAQKLEEAFASQPQFPLSESRNRQITGKMAKFILGHFGYQPVGRASAKSEKLRDFSKAKYFRQSAVYQKSGTPACSIFMEIR